MRQASWVIVVTCIAMIGASAVEAKGPHRIWHKRAKSSKTTKKHGAVYAPLPSEAPLAPAAPGTDDEVPEVIEVEDLPPMPPIEDSSARLDTTRVRWSERLQRATDRRTQMRQQRVEGVREFAARMDRSANDRGSVRLDREAVAITPPGVIAAAPSRAESSRLRSRIDRTAPQPVEARRAIADRLELRRQSTGPAFPNEAPRFDPSAADSSVLLPPAS